MAYFLIRNQTIVQAIHYVNANKEIANEDIVKQKEQELQKIHRDTDDERASLLGRLIKEDKAVYFIEMVEKVGVESSTKLELGSITTSDTGTLKANVTVSGSWQNVMTALVLLENLPISSKISNIDLSASGGSGKEVKSWILNLTIEALTIK
jgi:hypothetical protein